MITMTKLFKYKCCEALAEYDQSKMPRYTLSVLPTNLWSHEINYEHDSDADGKDDVDGLVNL